MSLSVTRREFLAATAAASTLAASAANTAPRGGKMKGPLVCVFSKHLQFLDYAELAKTCKEIGLDGVDLTVRKGGHVLPENVARDLPRAVDAIRGEGLEVPMITTRLSSGDDPDARAILEAAAKQGIPYFRIGGQRYAESGDPLVQLDTFADELAGLAKLAEEFDMTAGYHNHSGHGNVGAPLWDLHRMFERVGSKHLGSNFDVGHATVEGAYGAWEINARLMAPHVKMMAVKDFVWDKDRPRWVPLGEGIVKTAKFLKIFRETGFAGPMSLHFEYKVASNEALVEEVGRAAKTLRTALRESGIDD